MRVCPCTISAPYVASDGRTTPSRSAVCAMASCLAMRWVPMNASVKPGTGPSANDLYPRGNGSPVGNLLTALAGEKKMRGGSTCVIRQDDDGRTPCGMAGAGVTAAADRDDHLRPGCQRAFHRQRPEKEADMRERQIEQRLTQAVRQRQGLCPKWVSPGLDGVPDRTSCFPAGGSPSPN